MKPDFKEDVLQFEGGETTVLYLLRFQAFEQNFSMPRKRIIVSKINLTEDGPISSTAESAGTDTGAQASANPLIISAVTI